MDTTNLELSEHLRDALSPLPGTIIGLMGRKQSGKDTIAEHLIEEYGFTRYAFADPIKEACQVIFGFTKEQCWGDQKEVVDPYWNITPRKVFQIMGTELFQFELPKYAAELADIGRTFWAYRFARWYEQQLAVNPNIQVVITDCRFPFEADLIKSLGGTVIKVIRPNQVYNDNHASEVEMDTVPYDYLIENDGTIEDLEIKVKAVFEQLFV
jgi:hypothetical protein